jgi:hypothetical protein
MFDKLSLFTAKRRWDWNEDTEWEPTHCSQNREFVKASIDATQQEYPADILKDMKVRFEDENKRYREARR